MGIAHLSVEVVAYSVQRWCVKCTLGPPINTLLKRGGRL